MNINNWKYFNFFATKIVATIANKYSKIIKIDFHIFVKSCDINNNAKKETTIIKRKTWWKWL